MCTVELEKPLYLQTNDKSRKSYNLMRESFEVIKILQTNLDKLKNFNKFE